ncbi:MAG: hypothetical protein JSU72_15125 [Deltaproteobacteria bacterium]|nr:MAG: hypothetical protein JSU72_15125 [Deltaproteobacteria bacterium]
MARNLGIIIILIILFIPASGGTQDTSNYYIEKVFRGENLTTDEINNFLTQLEFKTKAFEKQYSKIIVTDLTTDNPTSDVYEKILKADKSNLQTSFQIIEKLRKDLNSISLSIGLYIVLQDLLQNALDLSLNKRIRELFGETHIELGVWCFAFRKAHLLPLALAKDQNRQLYVVK